MLTQSEADALIAVSKQFVVPTATVSVAPGSDATHELTDSSEEERFLLDLARGRRKTVKLKFQTRAKKVVVLLRLDLNGAPHTNPDGQSVGPTHLHIYRESYEDKWAYELGSQDLGDASNGPASFRDFCRLANVGDPPTLQEGLL